MLISLAPRGGAREHEIRDVHARDSEHAGRHDQQQDEGVLILGAERRSPARSRVKLQGVAQVVAQPRALRQRRANLRSLQPAGAPRSLPRPTGPWRRRTIMNSQCRPGKSNPDRRLRRARSCSVPIGTTTSKRRPTSGPKKPSGVTPMMVNVAAPNVRGLPMTSVAAAEMGPPEFVADDRGRAFRPAAPPIVIDRKRAAERSAHAEYAEELAARANDADELQLLRRD